MRVPDACATRCTFAFALALASCATSHDALRDYNLGQRAGASSTQSVAAIAPDGTGLPNAHGSVAEGAALYESRCANCHDTPAFPQLWGGIGSLGKAVPQKSVGSYWPYATTVYDYIGRAMPPSTPQRLRPSEIYALTAFVLAKNGIVSDRTVLDAHSLPLVKMPNHAGFFASDGKPDT